MAVWQQNPDLMERLRSAQNTPALSRVDVMTFAGMCRNREELLRHVWSCESQARGRIPERRS